jgi:nucleotide-binding universal stress UspA family protein
MQTLVRGRPEEGLVLSDRERRAAQELEADLLADEAFARAVQPATRHLASPAAPVVVGLGPDGDFAAVEWAAAEAAAQRCPLHVVHAVRPPVVLDPLCLAPPLTDPATGQVCAARRVDAAVARARTVAPDVEVSGWMSPGSVARVLQRESRDARLLVLGAPPSGPPRSAAHRLVQGSLRTRVIAAARCPAAVVHPLPDPPAGSPSPRVVVGVDGTPRCARAVAFAFRAARQRDVALAAVHAWTADCPADLEAITAPLSTTEDAAYALVEQALARWRREYPDVPVTTEVVRRDPVDALVAGSVGAALVVVGSRCRGRALGAVFGSVSRAVLDRAAGPVAVVPHVARPIARET